MLEKIVFQHISRILCLSDDAQTCTQDIFYRSLQFEWSSVKRKLLIGYKKQ